MRTVKEIDDSKRLEIIEEHLSGVGKSELAKKYGLSSYKQISRWMLTFGVDKPTSEIKQVTHDASMVESEREELVRIRRENKTLKKDLYQAKMKEDVYRTVVEIAEEQLHIPIRKKFGTK